MTKYTLKDPKYNPKLDRFGNVERPAEYTQVVVWEGLDLGKASIKTFEEYFKELKTRIKFLEVIVTDPDKYADGSKVPDSGGRTDVLFAIHKDDISGFSTKRFEIGRIRWIEDVIDNRMRNQGYLIHPKRVTNYRIW